LPTRTEASAKVPFLILLRSPFLRSPVSVCSGFLFSADWYYAKEIGDYVANLATGKGPFLNQAVHYLLDKKSRAATG
jgi:hypothetical protein